MPRAGVPSTATQPTLTIALVSNNREAPLRRLCASLLVAEYRHTIFSAVHLVFNMEASSSPALIHYAQELQWPHGYKQVRLRVKQGGLIPAVTESWYPSHHADYGLILEDDIEVSPLYLSWASWAISTHLARPDPRLVGISLYSPKLTETSNPRRSFDGNMLTEELTGERELPYLMQTPCSWGAIYFPGHWQEFLAYMQLRLEIRGEAAVEIPRSRTNGWKASWKKYFFELMYIRGTYMMYPNFEGQVSLSTNHMEAGEHIPVGGSTQHDKSDFVVPLMTDRTKLAKLPLLLSYPLPVVNLFGNAWLDQWRLSEALQQTRPPQSDADVLDVGSSLDSSFSRILMSYAYDNATQTLFSFSAAVQPDGNFVVYCTKKSLADDAAEPKPEEKKLTEVVGDEAQDEPASPSAPVAVAVWSSKTFTPTEDGAPPPSYSVQLTARGALQLTQLAAGGHQSVLWQSPDDPEPHAAGTGYHARLESNGNLVVFRGRGATCDQQDVVWESGSGRAALSPPLRCTRSTAEALCPMFPMQATRFFRDAATATVIISSTQRYDVLANQLQYYARSPVVSAIVVAWRNIHVGPPDDAMLGDTMVRFVAAHSNSPNNRLAPLVHVTTEAVLLADDDIKVHLQDVFHLFQAWRAYPHHLVGLMPRWLDSTGARTVYQAEFDTRARGGRAGGDAPRAGYSLMLARAMVMHRDYLHLYTCDGGAAGVSGLRVPSAFDKLRRAVHELVDQHGACEDIGLNFVAAAALHDSGRAAPMFVQPLHSLGDFGKRAGGPLPGAGARPGGGNMVQSGAADGARATCVSTLNALFREIAGTDLPPQTMFIDVLRVSDTTSELKAASCSGLRPPVHDDCIDAGAEAGGGCSWAPPENLQFAVELRVE